MAAARANWKGYLRLSLVSCPIALFPATSESEKVRFNQLNKNTGNRIRYRPTFWVICSIRNAWLG